MKKITAFTLIFAMLVSIFAMSVSADGTIIKSNFEDMETFTQHFHAGAFYVEDGSIFGYDEAKCLQSKGEWYVYDTSIEVVLADDDLADTERRFSMWYPNTNLYNYGRYEGTNYMVFGYNVEDKTLSLSCADLNGGADSVILAGPIDYEIEDNKAYIFGLSVNRGHIRCYIGSELVLEFVDTNDDYLIGLNDESTVPTALVYWNDGNFIQINEVIITDPGVLYPFEKDNEDVTDTDPIVTEPTDTEATETEPSDDPAASETEPSDDPAVTESEATTAIETEIVTNEDGETEVVTHIVTEEKKPVTDDNGADNKPAPDTNTGKPQGGNSTTTGDISFIVVAAMVTALGAALIVRKVNVK